MLAAILAIMVLPVLVITSHADAAVGSQPERIMPLGDSITYGAGSDSTSGYRAALWDRLVEQAGYNIDFVGSQQSGALPDRDNEGHPGWRIDQIAADIDGWMSTYQPDVVLLHIGTNDMNQGYHVATAPQRLGALLDQILADRPATVIIVAKIVPSLNPVTEARIKAYNAALPGIAAARGSRVHVVDMSALSPADMHDNLHPNDLGCARVAVRWYSALETVLGDGRDWPLFADGFETGQPAGTEAIAHTGTRALMYSGNDNAATPSYSSARLFSVDIPLTVRSVLSYWIYPQLLGGTDAAVDLRLSDGTADYQGHGGHLVANKWNLVRVGLSGLAGGTISGIYLGLDRLGDTGAFRGYVDDLSISDVVGAYPGVNLALHARVSGSPPCTAAESAGKALDGVIAGDSKWCSRVDGATLQVDLGARHTIHRLVVRGASVGGEMLAWDPSAYTIMVSTNGITWTPIVTVSGNTDGVITNTVAPTAARFVRLAIVTPDQDGSAATRIYDFEVDGT
jgi:lysophospholipase L1-like esterase